MILVPELGGREQFREAIDRKVINAFGKPLGCTAVTAELLPRVGAPVHLNATLPWRRYAGPTLGAAMNHTELESEQSSSASFISRYE